MRTAFGILSLLLLFVGTVAQSNLITTTSTSAGDDAVDTGGSGSGSSSLIPPSSTDPDGTPAGTSMGAPPELSQAPTVAPPNEPLGDIAVTVPPSPPVPFDMAPETAAPSATTVYTYAPAPDILGSSAGDSASAAPSGLYKGVHSSTTPAPSPLKNEEPVETTHKKTPSPLVEPTPPPEEPASEDEISGVTVIGRAETWSCVTFAGVVSVVGAAVLGRGGKFEG